MERGDRLRNDIAERGFALATVTGTSMFPVLRPGDFVRLEAGDGVRTGHVVAFENRGGLLVHRVVRITPGHVVCRGDNRLRDDGVTPRSAIIGRAVAVYSSTRPQGRRIHDGCRALLWADARNLTRRATLRGHHVAAEVDLFLRQARGRDGSVWASTPVAETGQDARAAAAAVTEAGEVSALVYSSLASATRVALVKGGAATLAPDRALVVHALAMDPGFRLARLTAALRAGSARAGLPAGDPGDTTWPAADGLAYVAVHLFSRQDFVAELRRAGVRVVSLDLATEDSVRVWSASVVASAHPGHQSPAGAQIQLRNQISR